MWKGMSDFEATWEEARMTDLLFPDFLLEDKVSFFGGRGRGGEYCNVLTKTFCFPHKCKEATQAATHQGGNYNYFGSKIFWQRQGTTPLSGGTDRISCLMLATSVLCYFILITFVLCGVL